ncbi:hypothetical protein OIU84_012178 [Salix udensis]|uniref:Uncharacterized protein n=1 Tax=Salix udensis TaxID=889485 RepID=A0AAD6JF38_9ROSI|nr:hypothetical protein OIU84_012178 [Salix udensis]
MILLQKILAWEARHHDEKRDSNVITRKKMAEVRAAAGAGFDKAKSAGQKAKAGARGVSKGSRSSTRISVQNKL